MSGVIPFGSRPHKPRPGLVFLEELAEQIWMIAHCREMPPEGEIRMMGRIWVIDEANPVEMDDGDRIWELILVEDRNA